MILNTIIIAIGISICAGLIKLALEYWNSYRLLLRSKVYRGPKALPIIGSGHLFLGSTSDVFKKIHELIDEYDSPFRVWLGQRIFFGIHDAEHIKLVLTNSEAIQKEPTYDVLKPWFGDGLLTATASIWRPHRKAIQPAFNSKNLESFIEIFSRQSLLVSEKIGKEGKEFDVYRYMSRYSLDTICETTMGVSVNALNNEDCTYLYHVKGVLEISYLRAVRAWLYFDFIFHRTSFGRRYADNIKYIHDFTEKVLTSARQNAKKGLTEVDTSRKSFMGQLLNSTEGGIRFTDKEIHDEISTVVGAGYDTTANLLTYTMFILANYPEIQNKVYEELREIYGDCDSETKLEVKLQDLNRMEYLDRVLKEAMRLFPATAVLGRRLLQDIDLGDYILPAGSSVLLGFFTIHRSEKYWPNPLEVNPDRFLPNHPMGPRHPYAYIPFSAGPRNCIGMKYANISTKTILSTLVWRYHIKTKVMSEAKDLEMMINVTLKPKNSIMLYVEKRCPIST